MAKEKILDVVVGSMKQSPQKYITRYHNTGNSNAINIVKGSGIKPSNDYEGNNAVFTTANPNAWVNYKRPAQIELQIPKKWYVEHSIKDAMDRFDNKDVFPYLRKADPLSVWDDKPNVQWQSKISDRVYNGGRTSLFDNEVPVEFIRRLCLDKGTPKEQCFDEESLRLMKIK